ncbi:unnamed protein product [Coregonus sp. 'balchen']|nr:unnamed protein product [Coregonus sp. 'balchen']
MMGLTPSIRCYTIVCGPEGVAAPVLLTPHQKQWYMLGKESAPHVTLAVGHGFEARSLGPMIRRASKLTWLPTSTPGIYKATSEKMWRFMEPDTTEKCLPERLPLPRHHGKPYTDHPSTEALLSTVDSSLWTTSPFDKQEGERKVLMYHSSKLDPIEKGQTTCSRYVAAVAKAIDKTAHLVMCHPLQIHTHHGVAAHLTSKEFTFSAKRKTKIQNKCTQSHISFVNTDKNMADALNSEEGLPHSCAEKAAQELKLRPDLKNEPIDNPDQWLYTDGCCYKGEEGNVAAYAVVQQLSDGSHVTLESAIIPQPASAQLAEIIGLTQALIRAEGKVVNIYTDSAYAHGSVHTDGPQWVRRNFTTAGDVPIKHRTQMEKLISSVALPAQVAIMKCKGHQHLKNRVNAGNNAADKAAKKAGGYLPRQMVRKAQEGELSGSTLPLKVNVGDWVRVKVHKRKWLEPRWTGPYEVKEVTSHSVQVRGKSGAPWHHLTHCTPAPTPSRTLTEVRADLSSKTTI